MCFLGFLVESFLCFGSMVDLEFVLSGNFSFVVKQGKKFKQWFSLYLNIKIQSSVNAKGLKMYALVEKLSFLGLHLLTISTYLYICWIFINQCKMKIKFVDSVLLIFWNKIIFLNRKSLGLGLCSLLCTIAKQYWLCICNINCASCFSSTKRLSRCIHFKWKNLM